MSAISPTPDQSSADDVVRFGPVHLNVTDEDRSINFWHNTLGMDVLERAAGSVSLGVDRRPLVVLHPGATRPSTPGFLGLYHLALHLPSAADFARTVGRLMVKQVPNSPTDHTMHWATYLSDPDGIGLELSFETIERFKRYLPDDDHGLALEDSSGRRKGGVLALDLKEVFEHLTDRDFDRPLPRGTRVGHLHLHVSDLQRTLDFYERIGFVPQLNATSFGFADMSANGSFPHRLAINIWAGPHATQPEPGRAGLRNFTLEFRSEDTLAAALQRIAPNQAKPEQSHSQTEFRDPSGNRFVLDREN